jgi:hypothetical protein
MVVAFTAVTSVAATQPSFQQVLKNYVLEEMNSKKS